MASEKIRIDYSVNDKELRVNKKLLEELADELDLSQDQVDKLTKKFKDQDKQLAANNKLLTGLAGTLQTTANKINIMGVGLGDATASLAKSTKGIGAMIKSLKLFKVALASTGIGLLIVALGSLVTFFTKTQRGIDKANQAFAAIGATVAVFVDRISLLGEKLLNLDFTNLLDVFSGIGDEIQREASAASTLEAALQRVRDAEIQLNIQRAETRARVKELNQIAEDITKSDQERADAAREAIRIESDLLDQQLELQQKKVALITEQNRLGESTVEDVEREAEARIQLANITEQSLELQTTLTNKLNIIENQRLLKEQKRLQTIQDEVDELGELSKELGNITKKADELGKSIQLSLGENGIAKTASESLAKVGISIQKTQEKIKEDSDKRTEEELIKNEERNAAINEGVNQSIAVANQLFETRVANIQKEFQALEFAKNAELELAGNNADQRAKIEAKFAAKAAELKTKEAKAEKSGALFSIAVETARAVVAALPNIPLSIIIGAFGAAQAAAVASQPLPKFKKGGMIQGNSHDLGGVALEAEGGEYILNRNAVNKYGKNLLDDINDMSFKPQSMLLDTSPIAKELSKRPEAHLHWNEQGFTSYMRKKNNTVKRKSLKYAI